MSTTTISIDPIALRLPVPIQPFVHATLLALAVMAGQAPIETDGLEGAIDPTVPKTHPINRALLALQASLSDLGLPIEVRLAATQRFLALINSNVQAPELRQFVACNEAGQVTGLSATLIAGAACADLDPVDPRKVEFDVCALAEAAQIHGGEIMGTA